MVLRPLRLALPVCVACGGGGESETPPPTTSTSTDAAIPLVPCDGDPNCDRTVDAAEMGSWQAYAPVLVPDTNGDGVPELAVLAADPYLVVKLLTDASTTLDRPGTEFTRGTSVAAAGDVNGDGLEDLFVGAYDASIYLERAPFGAEIVADSSDVEIGPDLEAKPVAHDLDGDGTVDLLALGEYAIDTFLGPFTASRDRSKLTISGDLTNRALFAVGDLQGDGVADVMFPSAGASTLSIADAAGSGDLDIDGPQPVGWAWTSADVENAKTPGDFDGDGRDDAVFLVHSTWYVVESGIEDEFDPVALAAAKLRDLGSGSWSGVVSAGDLDGDGGTDLLVDGFKETWLVPSGVQGAFSADDSPAVLRKGDYESTLGPTALDVDQDGTADFTINEDATLDLCYLVRGWKP